MMKLFHKNVCLYLPGIVFAVVLVSGCGSSGQKVVGTVKLPDGSPLSKGGIMFDNGQTNVIGNLDAKGRFTLYQFKPGDGVPPGNYQGMIRYEVDIPFGLSPAARNAELAKLLPFSPKYLKMETAGLTLTVEAGKNVAPLEIVLEK